MDNNSDFIQNDAILGLNFRILQLIRVKGSHSRSKRYTSLERYSILTGHQKIHKT